MFRKTILTASFAALAAAVAFSGAEAADKPIMAS